MNKKKTATMVASLALVGAIGAGSTLAYLSAQGNKLTNSFEVGDAYNPVGPKGLAVWIDETDLDDKFDENQDLLINDAIRTFTGNEYTDVLAGSVFTKDPILRITNNSMDSYGYIKVVGITADHGITINTEDWVLVQDLDNPGPENDFGNGIYRYDTILEPKQTEEDALDLENLVSTTSLFKKADSKFEVNVPTDFDEETLPTIELKGLAVQARYKENGVVKDVPVETANGMATSFDWSKIQ